MGASAVSPSSLPRKCARVLDQRQSSARATNRARTGLSVAQRSGEMFLIHGDRAEPALPEMTATFATRLNDTGITTMHPRKCAAQPVRIGRHQDEVHVVRHQAPGPYFDPGSTAIRREQLAVKRIVVITEKGALAAIATLGDMVRMTGDDNTGKTGHAS